MTRCDNAAGPAEQKMGFTGFQFLQKEVFLLYPDNWPRWFLSNIFNYMSHTVAE